MNRDDCFSFRPSFLRDQKLCMLRRAATTSRATREPATMSRNLPKGAPLPKAPFAAGVAIMGGMFYAVLLDAKGRQPDTLDTPAAEQGGANTLSVDADTSSSVPSSTVTAKTKSKTGARFLGGYEEVCAPTARYTCMCMYCMHTAHTLPGIGGQRTIVCARFHQPGQRAKAAGALRPAACARPLPIHPLHCTPTSSPPAACICTLQIHRRSYTRQMHCMCTTRARQVHCTCTACARHEHGMCTCRSHWPAASAGCAPSS